MIRKFLLLLPMLLLAAPALADSQGSATGGTAGTQSTAMGCRYLAADPTLTNGQQITVRCDVNGKVLTSGGGGGGGGAVYGPTANGSPAANPPVLMGGTSDGTGTGAVGNAKVDSSGNQYNVVSVPSGGIAAGGVAAGALATGAGSDGWDATQGAKSDSVCSTATGTCTLIGLIKYLNNSISQDPCGGAKSFAPFSLTASGQIITGTSAKKTYICSINLVSATAQNIALVEGTGSVCATNIFGLGGGTTAATGWNLAANGGLTEGAGVGTVVYGSGDTNATAANVCLLLSSTGQTSGTIGYVQQ